MAKSSVAEIKEDAVNLFPYSKHLVPAIDRDLLNLRGSNTEVIRRKNI